MRLFAPLAGNPRLLLLVLLLALVIISGAILVAYDDRRRREMLGFPDSAFPTRRLAASAPLEALAALHARLLELQQHVPAGSDDRRWLRAFTGRLRAVMDEAYARLEATPPPVQGTLLDRLAVEVEALAGVVNLQLGAMGSHGADRQALDAQLAALRAALR